MSRHWNIWNIFECSILTRDFLKTYDYNHKTQDCNDKEYNASKLRFEPLRQHESVTAKDHSLCKILTILCRSKEHPNLRFILRQILLLFLFMIQTFNLK